MHWEHTSKYTPEKILEVEVWLQRMNIISLRDEANALRAKLNQLEAKHAKLREILREEEENEC